MDKWPVVTAIVNTYERPTKLRSALSSVLAQDFSDFEVIVIHDGPSSARTKHVCEEFAEKFTARSIPFQHVATSENSGYQCTPKNVATWMARGDYIAYLDDDNEWTPDHLSVLLHAIEEEHKWPDFTYGRREYRFANGYTSDKLRTGPSPFVPFEKEALERMSASPMANFIDTSFGDWEFFSRGIFFSGWRGKAVDKVVQYYYWHGENIQLTRPAKEVPTGTPA
jgi:glycosyltransferase involved in cell wall biosynthesis